MDAMKEGLLELILSALEGFDSMVRSATNVLSGSLFDVNSVWSAAIGISTTLRPFCYIVICICLLLEIAQVAQKVDIIKFEHGVKIGVKMVLAKVCIDIAPTFLRACYNQSVLWINSLGGGWTNLGSRIAPDLEVALNNVNGLWAILGLFVSTLLLALAIKICGLLIMVIAYGRFFEIMVYLAVSPLPCAFFPLGDGTGGGFSRITQKFFKSFIAVCLQGVMMLICIRIFSAITDLAFNNFVSDASSMATASGIVSELCYTMLLFAIVLVMAVAKCGSWARSIIDAM